MVMKLKPRGKTGGTNKLASFAPGLDQFNFVTFWRIDKCNRAPFAMRMRPVGERIPLGRSLSCEFFQIVHFKGKMGQVRSNHYWTAFIILATLDLFFALGRFKKNELRAAPRGVPSCFP